MGEFGKSLKQLRAFGLCFALLVALLSFSQPAHAVTGIRSVYTKYDIVGHPIEMHFDSATGADSIVNSYDGFGELTSSTETIGTLSKQIQSHYDGGGRRDTITHPDGQAFAYSYDNLDRMTGLYVGTTTGTTLDSFSYNDDGTLGSRSEPPSSSSVSYTWDAIGRLTAQSDTLSANNVSWNFTINPASQISSETRNNDAYAYGGLVNVNRNYAVNGLNQYTSAGSASFTYDTNGNLTSDGTNSYTYDIENHLVSMVTGSVTVTLTYDPLGRLFEVKKQTSGTTNSDTKFIYDGDKLTAEYDGSNNFTVRYNHGANGAADDPLVYWPYTGGVWYRYFLHADHEGSIVALEENTGSVLINSYDEYGIPASANTGRFQYTGQEWIPELGMYYYKARMYSPTLGRFMQTDPIGYKDQINLYEYVGDDPMDKNDPTGTETGQFANGFVPDINPIGREGFNELYEYSGLKDAVNFFRHPSLKNGFWFAMAVAPIGKFEKLGVLGFSAVSSAIRGGGRLLLWSGRSFETYKGARAGDFIFKMTEGWSPQLNERMMDAAISEGRPIADTVLTKDGALAPGGKGIEAERDQLQTAGWKFDQKTGEWKPHNACTGSRVDLTC